MAKVTGVGGFFFKTSDKKATAAWLKDVLGIPAEEWGAMFPETKGYTVLGLHAADTTYFGPSTREFMLNFRVDDLDGMLARLEGQGVQVVKRFDPDPNGRFAHVRGPDGMVIELWQPVAEDHDP
jgi:predicted enzyme related to lactoylglutathione lyase